MAIIFTIISNAHSQKCQERIDGINDHLRKNDVLNSELLREVSALHAELKSIREALNGHHELQNLK